MLKRTTVRSELPRPLFPLLTRAGVGDRCISVYNTDSPTVCRFIPAVTWLAIVLVDAWLSRLTVGTAARIVPAVGHCRFA